jgi:hypothetical protein
MDIYKTPIFKTISGDMLVGNPVEMVIRGCELEKVTNDSGTVEKPHLYFEKTKKPLVLNATNSKVLARALGRETNDWRGARVRLYAESIKAFGKQQNAARLEVIAPPPKLTPAEHKSRKASNTALLRGDDPGAIGEEPETIQPLDLYAPAPEAEAAPVEEFNF